jgi:hypothetical protein
MGSPSYPRTVTILAVFAAASALAFLGWQLLAPAAHKPTNREKEPVPPPVSWQRRLPIDDSGFIAAQGFWQRVTDPMSMDHLRDCYWHAGRRGIPVLQRQLVRRDLAPGEHMNLLFLLTCLHMYEGQFAEATAIAAEARALAEKDLNMHGHVLPTLIFLQGVVALRRGETENCVECRGISSCIFPIQPEAVHQKRSGSAEAVRHFTDYLRRVPDDIGARWLLNLAYMTLGEYPDKVPPEYLIPLDKFRSEFDIGRFRDVAPLLGVNRLGEAGGAIMDDFDNDGLLDLVLTSSDWGGPMTFFRNKGDGTFEDRTEAAGLAKQIGGLYCVQTDYNNDGWLDVYVARGGWHPYPARHSLLRNNGDGTFTDVTEQAGLGPMDGQAVAWADYDNDGWLDVFVGSEHGRSRLYHNRGDGTFEEVSAKAGINTEGVYCKGASWGDFDGDGYPDLYLSNFNGPPRLYRNNRDGTFTDVAAQVGITRPVKGFSCWFWDYDNDGRLDLFATSFDRSLDDVVKNMLGLPTDRDTCRLYRNVGGRFEDVTEAAGVALVASPMGSNFADLDNDGFLDFYLATGEPTYSMLVPNRLFKNVGGKRFADISLSSGTGHLQKGHGVACGDWDRDGNVDLFVELGGTTPGDAFRSVLFQNPGQGNHWLTVKLVGKKTNRPAVGAQIKVTLPGEPPRSVYRHVNSGSSFGANPLQQTIGLGKADRITSVEVVWPTSGTTQVFREVAVDQAIEIAEFDTRYRPLKWTRVPLPR